LKATQAKYGKSESKMERLLKKIWDSFVTIVCCLALIGLGIIGLMALGENIYRNPKGQFTKFVVVSSVIMLGCCLYKEIKRRKSNQSNRP